MRDERIEMIAEGMRRANYDALICRLPEHVTMLTGYQPILGNTFCLVSRAGTGVEFRMALPKDETDLVPKGTATTIKTFTEETLSTISTTIPSVREPLKELLAQAGLPARATVGYEGGRSPIATAYTQVGIPGATTLDLLRELLPDAQLHDATALLEEMASVKTGEELDAIRRAETVARAGFEAARSAVHVGAGEADVHAATYGALIRAGFATPGALIRAGFATPGALIRAGFATPGAAHVVAHVHVMTGKRAAQAYKAFNLTSGAVIARGDTVSVQLEVSVNGYWAELTRGFFAGEVSDTWVKAHQACVTAQDAALRVIRDGVAAKDVDAAARDVMRAAGFGDDFKHGLGHGFGFQAINHAAAPIVHPASHHTLRAGMVHNMEPAVYLDGVGGFRLNDDVAVTAQGAEVLSKALPRDLEWLVVKE
jgi:Xaa-Pro aminopeptidase